MIPLEQFYKTQFSFLHQYGSRGGFVALSLAYRSLRDEIMQSLVGSKNWKTHPDIFFLEKGLTADQARLISDFSTKRPIHLPVKFIYVTLDTFTVYVQNMVLKTLESLSSNCFLFETNNYDGWLDPVKSRSVFLSFNLIDRKILMEKGISKTEIFELQYNVTQNIVAKLIQSQSPEDRALGQMYNTLIYGVNADFLKFFNKKYNLLNAINPSFAKLRQYMIGNDLS